MTNLIRPPAMFELPFSRGGDLYFAFEYQTPLVDDDGQPVLDEDGRMQFRTTDYPAGAVVELVVETKDAANPLVIEASIKGSLATVWEPASVADTVPSRKRWRAVLNYPDGLRLVMCNGLTTRWDGRRQMR